MRVLVVRLGAIGDVVRALPVIQVLRENLRDAGIFWLVGESASGVLKGEDLDGVLVFRGNPVPLLKRFGRFDLVIDFQGLLKSSLLSSLFSRSEVYGPSPASGVKEPSFFFYGKAITVDPMLNRVERNLRLLEGMGFGIPDSIRFKAVIPLENMEEAHTLMDSRASGWPIVFMHPGSSKSTPYKRWHEERYALLSKLLFERLGARVFLSYGSEFERGVCERVVELSGGACEVFPRVKELKTLFAVYSMAHLFIGNDTGPMHIASFSGTNTLGIFGPTNVHVNRPVGEGVCDVIRVKVPCSPCRNRSCEKRLCFDKIHPETVFYKAVSMLRARRSG